MQAYEDPAGEQSDYRPNRSTTDMMFVISRLQELARMKRNLLYVCFIGIKKAYNSVDHTHHWTVIAHSASHKMLSWPCVNSIMACEHARGLTTRCVRCVQEGLRQGYVLAPLLFHISFVAVLNVAYTHLKADNDTKDALVHLRNTKEAARPRGATTGESSLAMLLWGMLYADDAEAILKSSE